MFFQLSLKHAQHTAPMGVGLFLEGRELLKPYRFGRNKRLLPLFYAKTFYGRSLLRHCIPDFCFGALRAMHTAHTHDNSFRRPGWQGSESGSGPAHRSTSSRTTHQGTRPRGLQSWPGSGSRRPRPACGERAFPDDSCNALCTTMIVARLK